MSEEQLMPRSREGCIKYGVVGVVYNFLVDV